MPHYPYIIIGAGACAVLYAKRILRRDPNARIYMITEGVDNTGVAGINDPDFGIDHYRDKTYYTTIPMETVSYGGQITDPSDDDSRDFSTHWTPSGPLGDTIALARPEVPEVISHNAHGRAEFQLKKYSTVEPLSSLERNVAECINSKFGIDFDCHVRGGSPGMINKHRLFLEGDCGRDTQERVLLLQEYLDITSTGQVTVHCQATDWDFVRHSDGSWTVSSNAIDFPSPLRGKLRFKTDLWDIVRIATQGGISNLRRIGLTTTNDSSTVRVPVQYVGVTPVDEQFNDISLSFSLSSFQTNSSRIMWLVDVFTKKVAPEVDGFATAGNTLLVVSATKLEPQRRLLYSLSEQKFIFLRNKEEVEEKSLEDFLIIATGVFQCMGGMGNFPINDSLCDSSGRMCQFKANITANPTHTQHSLAVAQVCSCLYYNPRGVAAYTYR